MLAAATFSVSTAAMAYPDRPIDLIVPFAPGGVTDLVARQFAEQLSKKWQQPINVINRAGGSGTPGVLAALNAKPDGYTMLMYTIQVGTLNPASQKDLPYTWDKPTFVARTNVTPIVLVVGESSPYKSLADVLAKIKANPGAVKYSTSGPAGTGTHAMAQLFEAAKVDPAAPVKVVFNGGSQASVAVAGGHVDMTALNLPDVYELIAAKKLRPIAVTTEARLDALPQTPTGKEAGAPGFNLMGWNGVVGPHGLPDGVVKTWEGAIKEILSDEDFKKRLDKLGSISAFLPSGEFRNFVKDEYEVIKKNVAKLGL
jgi:tripartite-type tricarboxylate transporter receptor subunit TctC